ncbi:MAG TPA: DUF1361 domain-containing protein [Xanthomonadales bacterium]|nr:DUF1361 domain-containing protein [Xanthomonadales bacterium]
MSVNIFLALLPVILGWIFFVTKNRLMKIIIGLCWLAFLPNSIYVFTDLINLINQWSRVGPSVRLVFIFQYGVLLAIGFVTFILSMYPFEKFLKASKWVKDRGGVKRYLIILNFIIGFGITLGRVQRVNSWEVVTAPLNVINSGFKILFTPELVLLTILFGLFSNLLYFLFRKKVIKYFSTYSSQAGV